MKRLAYLITLTLVLVSCGSRSGHFKLEGRLLNLNQGEFYIYSTDGVFAGIDTIKVDGGRFAYEPPAPPMAPWSSSSPTILNNPYLHNRERQ